MTSEQAAVKYREGLALLEWLDHNSHAFEIAQQEIAELHRLAVRQEPQHEEWTAEFSLFAAAVEPPTSPRRSSKGFIWGTLLVAFSAWLGAYWLYSRWPGGHRIIWGDALAFSGICLAVAAFLAGVYDYRRMGKNGD